MNKLLIFIFFVNTLICIIPKAVSQNMNYEIQFRGIKKHEIKLPSLDKDFPITKFQYKNWINNPLYISKLDEKIDSVSIIKDTMFISMYSNDMYVVMDTINSIVKGYEFCSAVTNHKKNFVIKFSLSKEYLFNGNIIIINSFFEKYYFKKIKSNEYLYLYKESIDIDMNYIQKHKIQIVYEGIRS